MSPKSFSPVTDEDSRILILRTMPSAQSRKESFYYTHPRNRFWQVLAASLENRCRKLSRKKPACF
jgi:G:T/U-mismatch repair DNA glycosylase